MQDSEIVALYLERSERAIEQSQNKYGRYCHTIAFNILRSAEDSEECVNDTWFAAWRSIPPTIPEKLSAFFGKITRNLAINLYDRRHTVKRGGGEVESSLDELSELLSSGETPEELFESKEVAAFIDRYLETLRDEVRKVFVKRYFYLLSVQEIAKEMHMGESAVKMQLLRTRKGLRTYLEKEGVVL